MIKKIIKLIKMLYVKISCVVCCRSNCEVEIGRDTPNNNKKNTDENDKDE